MDDLISEVPAKLRADKWLWFARVVKTRTLAQTLIKTGKVRVNGTKITSPSFGVAVGDALTITLVRQIKIYQVEQLGTRRGPSLEAQSLFIDLSPVVAKPNRAEVPARQAVREEGAGRPTKKQRRAISRFRADIGEEF